ncbi:MAG: MarR family transcriptional regulator [Prevotellaceae bacterium]|jgi:DNA-binding MarR family transcriptional regulator|nr:MarR family transcriptional regulator [Prevotellaceae bacterium]
MKLEDNTFSVERAEDSSGFLLWQVTTIWQRKIKRSLEQYDLTHSQYVLLTSLYWFKLYHQEVTQIVLSGYAKIDPMTTSTVLKTLEKKGFIRRQEHSTDTRAKKIDITEQGKELIKKAIVTVETTDKEFFSSLSSKTKTLNELLIMLIKNNKLPLKHFD